MVTSPIIERHAQELSRVSGLKVDVLEEDGRLHVLLYSVVLPVGLFRIDVTDVLFITDQQYPLSALDMFWTELEVVLPDGRVPQNAESIETYIGRPWRRFSWHRNGVWNPAGNGLLDHFAVMEQRWAAEGRP